MLLVNFNFSFIWEMFFIKCVISNLFCGIFFEFEYDTSFLAVCVEYANIVSIVIYIYF